MFMPFRRATMAMQNRGMPQPAQPQNPAQQGLFGAVPPGEQHLANMQSQSMQNMAMAQPSFGGVQPVAQGQQQVMQQPSAGHGAFGLQNMAQPMPAGRAPGLNAQQLQAMRTDPTARAAQNAFDSSAIAAQQAAMQQFANQGPQPMPQPTAGMQNQFNPATADNSHLARMQSQNMQNMAAAQPPMAGMQNQVQPTGPRIDPNRPSWTTQGTPYSANDPMSFVRWLNRNR